MLTKPNDANGSFINTKEEFERFFDLITKILVYDPETRITPSNALLHDFFTK